MGAHVDLLIKTELEYELSIRNVKLETNQTVADLRKRLRSVLKLNIEPSAYNIAKKVVINDEIKTIKVALEELKLKIEECGKEKRVVDSLRCKAKINHYKLRLTVLSSFKVNDEQKKDIQQLEVVLSECETMFGLVEVDKDLESRIERRLSDSFAEDEEIEQNVMSKLNISNEANERPHCNEQLNVYAKLPNPVERHLKNVKSCDGLEARELLNFVKVMLKLKKESELSDFQILDVILGYTTGPLYSKIVEFKQLGHSIEEVHNLLLNYFVPLGLRENLKRELVNRPQKHNEPLSCYILEIRENSKLLNCLYSENDIVKLIIIGLNQSTRSRLALTETPTSFKELELLCVHEQNVAYEDTRRGSLRSSPGNHGKPVWTHNTNATRKCYYCGTYLRSHGEGV